MRYVLTFSLVSIMVVAIIQLALVRRLHACAD